jgi:K+-transporting ATPase c subunit
MREQFLISLRTTVVTLVLLGLLYPLAVTGLPAPSTTMLPPARWGKSTRARPVTASG